MRLLCLGTAGYHPNETRHTSCYLLPESGIVLDAGTGLFRLVDHIETDHLDILLTHAHLDHIAGLTFLVDVLHRRPVRRLRVWGEAAKLDAIRQHLFSELVFPVEIDAQWCPIDGQQSDGQHSFALDSCAVSWRPQQHPGGSVGYRLDFQGGQRLLYLTDTVGDESSEAIEWYGGSDLMMHECYFAAADTAWAETTGHTHAAAVARIAKAACPKVLLLTHINPAEPHPETRLAEVRALLASAPIESALAHDNATIHFGAPA